MFIRLNDEIYNLSSYTYAKACDLEKSSYPVTTVCGIISSAEQKNKLRQLIKDTFWENELQKKDETEVIIYLTLIDKNEKEIDVPLEQFVYVEVI